MAKRLDRQFDIVRAGELRFPVHIIGAGGIGSWTALLAAKMGCTNITVYDDDKVEDHNVASQFYKEDQLGEYKVDALAKNILEQTGIDIVAEKNIEEEETIPKGLVIMTIDTLAERRRLGEIFKDRPIYILDGRMGGLSFEVYNVASKEYLSTIVANDEAEPLVCTGKSICFNCSVIAGLLVNYVKRYAKNEVMKPVRLDFDFNSVKLLTRPLSAETIGNPELTTDVSSPTPETGVPGVVGFSPYIDDADTYISPATD